MLPTLNADRAFVFMRLVGTFAGMSVYDRWPMDIGISFKGCAIRERRQIPLTGHPANLSIYHLVQPPTRTAKSALYRLQPKRTSPT